jgi:hypothetical protein
MLLILCFTQVNCTSAQDKRSDKEGRVFAQKIFQLFEDLARKQLDQRGANEELAVERAKLPPQVALAVYFLPPQEKKAPWSWERKEKDRFITELQKGSRLSQVFELFPTKNQISDAQQLRLMASHQGADALLIINGVASVKSSANRAAASYLALLPMLFVRGNNVNGHFLSQAILWDVRKPIIHFGLESEGDWEMKRPLVFKQKPRAIRKSKEESLQDLSYKIEQRIREKRI